MDSKIKKALKFLNELLNKPARMKASGINSNMIRLEYDNIVVLPTRTLRNVKERRRRKVL
jgi:hypothetical protein